jgi:hypothetical protein
MKTLKPLPQPITLTIHIIYNTWLDKTYGNLYTSARVVVNNDYDNVLAFPMDNDSPRNMEYAILERVSRLYGLRLDLAMMSYSQHLVAGIYIHSTICETTKALCRKHGMA